MGIKELATSPNELAGYMVGRLRQTRKATGFFIEITKTYIENQENLEFFKENNPWAMEEIQKRLLEAYERGLWQPADGLLETSQESYLEI